MELLRDQYQQKGLNNNVGNNIFEDLKNDIQYYYTTKNNKILYNITLVIENIDKIDNIEYLNYLLEFLINNTNENMYKDED